MTGAAAVRGSFVVTADDRFLEGHFPRNPVFPGIGQLAQVVSLALGADEAIVGIEALRFRLALSPGDRLDLSGSRDGGRLRFELRRADRVATSGTLLLAGPDAGLRAGAAGAAGATSLPPLPHDASRRASALVPHRPPALLLEDLEAASAGGARATACIPPDHPARRAGRAPGFLVLEIASQAAAALETSLRSASGGGGPAETRPGYLVLAREVECAPELPDEALRIRLEPDGVSPPLALYRFALEGAAGPLARGLIGTWIAEGPGQSP